MMIRNCMSWQLMPLGRAKLTAAQTLKFPSHLLECLVSRCHCDGGCGLIYSTLQPATSLVMSTMQQTGSNVDRPGPVAKGSETGSTV